MDKHHGNEQHANDRQTGKAREDARQDENRADDFGEYSRKEAHPGSKAEGIFDTRQFFAEMKHLREAVYVQQYRQPVRRRKNSPALMRGG